jgi:hypothetical protein
LASDDKTDVTIDGSEGNEHGYGEKNGIDTIDGDIM